MSEEVTTQAETLEEPPVNRQVIDILFDFLRTDEEWNSVLCGYFVKLLSALLSSWKTQFNLFVMNPENKVVSSMIKHIYNWSLADFLVKLFNQEFMLSDYRNEVVDLVITSDDLKADVLMQIVDRVVHGDLES